MVMKLSIRSLKDWTSSENYKITLQTLTTMVTFPTTGQFTFMAKDQGGKIGKAHAPSYLWAAYLPTPPTFLPMGYLLI
jgi:hypothetical protein